MKARLKSRSYVDENEVLWYPVFIHCQLLTLEEKLLSSHDNESARVSLSILVWMETCGILPSAECREGPEEEICSRLFLRAPSAWLTTQWVIELDRYVFQNKVMCTVCAQLNNKAPVRFGGETASCDMPTGQIQLLSLQSCLGCLLA